jgi:hypothetical protein
MLRLREVIDERSLADAGLAADQHDAAIPGDGLGQHGVQRS